MVNWAELRGRFPSLEDRVYLNTATMGQLPKASTEAMIGHLARRDLLACADLLEWFSDMEGVRAKVARLVSAEPTDIAFVPSTSHALAIVLNGIDWKPGDRILTFADEFPNNTYAPSLLTRKGVEFLEVQAEELEEHLDERVRLVILSAMNYVTGYRHPLEGLRAKLDRLGALLYLDATQGCGGLEMNMARIEPDVMGVHGYKWLLSPTGAGFVYVRPEVRKWLEPNIIGWRTHHSWQDLDNLHHGIPEFSAGADRYEGYMPALPLLYAMEQSVDLMLEAGAAAIEQRVLGLAAEMREAITELGGTVAHTNTPILACRFAGKDASLLSRALNAQDVLTSARHGYLRISVHLYNNSEDVAALAKALRPLLSA